MDLTTEVLMELNKNDEFHAIYGKETDPLKEDLHDQDCLIRLFCFGHAGDQNLHLNILLR